MWGNDKAFYDILSMAAGNNDSYALQSFIDEFKDQYNVLDASGFAWAPMQADFSFQQLEKEFGVNAMATYVDIDSPGTPISYEGVKLSTGEIPRMKKLAQFNEKDYRQRLIAGAVGADPQLNAARSLLDATKKLIDAHTNSLTYNRHQMVSSGKFQLTEANNAGGIKGTLFTASIPNGNIVTKTSTAVWWDGDNKDGSTSDPIKDLKEIGAKAEERGSAFHWEVDKLTYKRTMAHAKVIEAIGYRMFPAAASSAIATNIANNAGADAQKAALESIIGFPVKVIDSISRVDTYDKAQKAVIGAEVRSFEPNVWALVPDGKIGEILSVIPIYGGQGDAGAYGTYYGGRLLMTYEYETRKKVQYIETEMTALIVPDKPKHMYILNVA
jgi:hypothetical protein